MNEHRGLFYGILISVSLGLFCLTIFPGPIGVVIAMILGGLVGWYTADLENKGYL